MLRKISILLKKMMIIGDKNKETKIKDTKT